MERFSLKKIARASVQLLAKYPPHQVMEAVAQELVAGRRVRDAESLVREIAAELLRVRQQAAVTVTSARTLPASAVADLKRMLKERLQAKTVAVESIVDPNLKGGVIVTTPIGTLDASIQERFNQLTQL